MLATSRGSDTTQIRLLSRLSLRQIAQTCGQDDVSGPFGYLLRLKAEPLLRY